VVGFSKARFKTKPQAIRNKIRRKKAIFYHHELFCTDLPTIGLGRLN